MAAITRRTALMGAAVASLKALKRGTFAATPIRRTARPTGKA
jgi:hypothetical protein